MDKKNKPIAGSKVLLSDTDKKKRKDSAKGKRAALAGVNYDNLKPAEKDALIKSLLESQNYIDKAGIVL